MNKVKLVFTFYRSFAFVSILISFSAAAIIHAYGIKTFTALFWFKIFSLILFAFFVAGFKKKELYYYRNLGLSGCMAMSLAMLLDMLLFLGILTLSILLR